MYAVSVSLSAQAFVKVEWTYEEWNVFIRQAAVFFASLTSLVALIERLLLN